MRLDRELAPGAGQLGGAEIGVLPVNEVDARALVLAPHHLVIGLVRVGRDIEQEGVESLVVQAEYHSRSQRRRSWRQGKRGAEIGPPRTVGGNHGIRQAAVVLSAQRKFVSIAGIAAA